MRVTQVPSFRHLRSDAPCSASACAQVAAKQRILEDNLAHRQVSADGLSPVHGQTWGYRQRAAIRAPCREKGKTLVGFREKKGRYVADLSIAGI